MSLRRPTKSNYGEPARVQQPPDDPPQDYPFEEDGLRADSPEDDQLTAFMDELNMSNDEDDTPSVSDSQPLETAKHGSEWLNELEYLYEDPAPFFKSNSKVRVLQRYAQTFFLQMRTTCSSPCASKLVRAFQLPLRTSPQLRNFTKSFAIIF